MLENMVPISSMTPRQLKAEKDRLAWLAEMKDKCLVMMKNPDSWSGWPILPLKKDYKDRVMEPGFLYDSEAKHTVFMGNIFNLPKDIQTLPKEEFSSFEAMFEAGWRVD